MRGLVTAIIAAGVLARGVPAGAGPSGAEAEALAHLDRGVAAFRAGDYALAEQELRDAQRLAPGHANPYRWLALTEVQLGECEAALVDVESFLSRVPAGDPRVPELTALRAHCVLELQARSHLEHARPAPAPAPAPRSSRPLSHRWWFWTAIGAVALTAAGVTYLAVHDDGPAQLPAITCGASGCMP